MKLIFTEYLASLKERGELDAIIPDLLSECGMTVLSRPALGTKQYGVDVAAVGKRADGTRSLYLLSIKGGDLRRSDWDGNPQALRPSLNQIRDVYIRQHVGRQHAELPVVIVLCIGGDLHEAVRAEVMGFMDDNTTEQITFELWNGEQLADLLLTGILRENALPQTGRSDLRKSVALVDEPDVCFAHYCRFVDGITERCKATRPARLTAVRQIYLGLWTLYVWARDTENLEAPYLCGERAVLTCWELAKSCLTGKTRAARQLRESLDRILQLHMTVAGEFINRYVSPRVGIRNGLAAAVPSHGALDVNLKMFDVLGRTAVYGLWQLHWYSVLSSVGPKGSADRARAEIDRTVLLVRDMLQNNGALCTPIKDNHAIEVNIVCLFLNGAGHNDIVRTWVGQVTLATMFAYRVNGLYPCVFMDYRELIDHPKDGEDYRHEATAGSLLIPTLAIWAALTDDDVTLNTLADFVAGDYKHSTLQLWFPDANSEENFYHGRADHGLVLSGFKIERTSEAMLAPIALECGASSAFFGLSAQQYGLWPLIILASRHHRKPVPPQFWRIPEEVPTDAYARWAGQGPSR